MKPADSTEQKSPELGMVMAVLSHLHLNRQDSTGNPQAGIPNFENTNFLVAKNFFKLIGPMAFMSLYLASSSLAVSHTIPFQWNTHVKTKLISDRNYSVGCAN